MIAAAYSRFTIPYLGRARGGRGAHLVGVVGMQPDAAIGEAQSPVERDRPGVVIPNVQYGPRRTEFGVRPLAARPYQPDGDARVPAAAVLRPDEHAHDLRDGQHVDLRG